jgi:hypothetical protein
MEMQLFRLSVLGSGDKREIVRRALSSDISVLHRSSKWTVSESWFGIIGDAEIASAYMIKYSDEDHEVYLEKNKTVVRAMLPDAVQIKCLVVVDMKNWVIAVQRVNGLAVTTSKDVLKKILVDGNGGVLVDVIIDEITNREEFVESVMSLDKVTFVSFTIHPSNPRWKPDWRITDEDLQMGNVGRWRSDIRPQSKEQGLNLFPGSRALSGILMAADGYGQAAVRGIKNGISTLFRTREGLKVINVGDEKERQYIIDATVRQVESYERSLDGGQA